MDDLVDDFERQPGEEIKEYEPQRDAMLTAIPQARASRGVSPCVENSQECTLTKW